MSLHFRYEGGRLGWVIHIGVGTCVARSDSMGNAKASGSGTSEYGSRAFYFYAFLYVVNIIPEVGNRDGGLSTR